MCIWSPSTLAGHPSPTPAENGILFSPFEIINKSLNWPLNRSSSLFDASGPFQWAETRAIIKWRRTGPAGAIVNVLRNEGSLLQELFVS